MKINGTWIYIKNHSMENLNKMYEWDHNQELIEIECGNKIRINDIKKFKEEIMESYIVNNHESNSPYCHFGIHRKSNGELIGYADLINIKNDLETAELCIALPDKKLRNKVYGMDSVITVLYFGFNIKGIKIIDLKTRIDNFVVMNICKKIGIKYDIRHFDGNGYCIDLAYYRIDKETYERIMGKLFKKYIGNYYSGKEERPPSVAGAS
jgi:RimJ/RimL family protein N-acetyltransferase